MQTNNQERGCIAPVVKMFFIAWFFYLIFFMVSLWLNRSFVWQNVLIFAGTLALVTTLVVRLNLRTVSPSTGMLVHPVSKKDIEKQYGADSLAWNKLKRELKKGDQIWLWAAFGYTWMALGGRYGYVIVRDGKPTAHFMFIEEKKPSH